MGQKDNTIWYMATTWQSLDIRSKFEEMREVLKVERGGVPGGFGWRMLCHNQVVVAHKKEVGKKKI